MTIISVEGLSVIYRSTRPRKREPVTGLDNVSLSLKEGETLGVVGESGSGKSTLGRVIAGLEPIDCGSVTVAGYDVDKFKGKVPHAFWDKVQMVWQDPLGSLTPTMRMGDILSGAFRRGRSKSKSEVVARLKELTAMVQMPMSSLERYAHELSGGQRQRIAIARAFAANPSVVVLDEAVSALDVLTQNQILQLLLDIQKSVGVSYVFISHDLGVVGKMADRTAVLYSGGLMEFGSTEVISSQPQNPYTKELMLSTLTVEPRENLPAWTTSLPAFDTLPVTPPCPYLSRCPYAVTECTVTPPPVVELAPGHLSKCHLAQPMADAPPEPS